MSRDVMGMSQLWARLNRDFPTFMGLLEMLHVHSMGGMDDSAEAVLRAYLDSGRFLGQPRIADVIKNARQEWVARNGVPETDAEEARLFAHFRGAAKGLVEKAQGERALRLQQETHHLIEAIQSGRVDSDMAAQGGITVGRVQSWREMSAKVWHDLWVEEYGNATVSPRYVETIDFVRRALGEPAHEMVVSTSIPQGAETREPMEALDRDVEREVDRLMRAFDISSARIQGPREEDDGE